MTVRHISLAAWTAEEYSGITRSQAAALLRAARMSRYFSGKEIVQAGHRAGLFFFGSAAPYGIGYNAPLHRTKIMDQKESLIEYPSDFPIKVMGATHVDFAPAIVEIITQLDPTFHSGKMQSRPSAKGNYTGLTVTIRATSREMLDDVYRALSSHHMVKMVL
jgi:putative lipoic acid-binding regulatory protein